VRLPPAPACVCSLVALPPGSDAVVMQEDTQIDPGAPGEVMILLRLVPGECPGARGGREAGHEARRGGRSPDPGRIGLLAAAGLGCLRVGRQPLVGLLATGSELTEPGSHWRPPDLRKQLHRPWRIDEARRRGP